MPYNYDLTWAAHAKRFRKRYLGRTYYLKSRANGKKDRIGYESALREWERLKAFIDGLGPAVYTATGALIPEAPIEPKPITVPSAPPTRFLPQSGQSGQSAESLAVANWNGEIREAVENLPPWILGTGVFGFIRPEQEGNPHAGEKRISALADYWLDQRQKQVNRGELSLMQWGQDKTKLQTFRDFISKHYPTVLFCDQLTPQILNHYRADQFDLLDGPEDDKISKITLKKRLSTLVRFLIYLIDEDVLATAPKNLRTYARVKLDRPAPVFFSPDEIKALTAKATQTTKLFLMLGLNCAFTQKEIATLMPEHIDWDTGIISKNRTKTDHPTQHKLWPSTLKLLKIYRNRGKGPVLLNRNGLSLLSEKVNKTGKVARCDTISLAFKRVMKAASINGSRAFKHLRKSSANLIEASRPDLTSLFLGHSEKATKRFYVNQHFEDLFAEVAKLESVFGFDKN